MKILLYLLVPVLVVVAFACASWVRNRQPTSLESGVDAFRREMSALSPDAAPLHRRRPDGREPRDASDDIDVRRPSAGGSAAPRPGPGGPPRRPPTSDGTR